MYSYYTRKRKQVQTLKISTILLGLSIADLQCRVGGVRTAPGDPIIYSFMYFMIGLEATPPPPKRKARKAEFRASHTEATVLKIFCSTTQGRFTTATVVLTWIGV